MKISTRDIVLRGWSVGKINELLQEEFDVVNLEGKKPVKLYDLDRVIQIEESGQDYFGYYKNREINMSINKVAHKVLILDHLFEKRNGEKRIGNLKKEKIRDLLRIAVNKTSILEVTKHKFVLTYEREDGLFSAILISKEGSNFYIISVYHSNEVGKRLGLFPNEKNSIDLTVEEANSVLRPIKKDISDKIIPDRKSLKRKIRIVSKNIA